MKQNYDLPTARKSSARRRPRSADYLKNRITCAYTPEERQAIEWLYRLPANFTLRKRVFQTLRGKPRRVIAKTLDAAQLAALVGLHRKHLEDSARRAG